jgi:micrococcal nuclease
MRAQTLFVALLVVSAGCLSGVPAPGAGDGAATGDSSGPTAGTPTDGVRVTVTEVVDGDTIKVAYPNGTRETVRLLGVDTPEVHAENAPEEFDGIPDTDAGARCLRQAGENASAYASDRLAGKTVTLVFDERADKRGYYGRLLAYVYVGNESFNYALLRDGHARIYESTFTERERYERAASAAREDRRGLWSCIDNTGGTVGTATEGPLAVGEVHADAAGNDHENLNDEYVTFRNTGDTELDLSGWTVSDDGGHSYTFPTGTTLPPGAELTLRTGSGTDTESEVYWDADGAVWNNGGDTITVRNANGTVVLRHSY